MPITPTGRDRLPNQTRHRSIRILVAIAVAIVASITAMDGVAADDGSLTSADPTETLDRTRTESERRDKIAPNPKDERPHSGEAKLAAPRATNTIYGHCQLDFNDPTIIATLPDFAATGALSQWNQGCVAASDINIAVHGYNSHYHMYYEDELVAMCTQLGTYGRHTEPRPEFPGQEIYDSWDDEAKEEYDDAFNAWIQGPCTEIDPLTEPREGVQPHAEGYSIEIFAYKSHQDGFVPFSIEQLRVVSGVSEVCHRAAGPMLAMEPGGDPWSCIELGPANWNLSQTVTNAAEVRIRALTSDNTVTDIGIWIDEML